MRFASLNQLSLNQSNSHLLVNFLQYTEYASDGSILKRFSWVTDLTITPDNAQHLVRGGRSRWKIENETFNTLKNQGYQFGHNFGHGTAEFVDDLGDVDDVGILGRPNAGTVLPLVSSGSQKANHSAIVVGPPAFPLPPFRVHLDAAAS